MSKIKSNNILKNRFKFKRYSFSEKLKGLMYDKC